MDQVHTEPNGTVAGIPRQVFIFIIATAFLTVIGFGVINPVAPFLVARYVPDSSNVGNIIGWLSAAYALCAFVAAPGLGALSDRYGRRPILLICIFGTAVGYLLFGIGGGLWVLFAGRIIDGITGGNQAVLFAYVADMVPPGQRGKYFGLIGATVGIGFVLGPTIGGLLAKLGYEVPFYVAAGLTFINVVYGYFFMPESLSKAKRVDRVPLAALNPFSILRSVGAVAQIRWLLAALFLYSLPFAALQANLGLFAKDSLGWDADAIGLNFALVGVTDILVQGIVLQWLLRRFSESRVATVGLGCTLVGYLLIASIAVVHHPAPLLLGTIVFAMGDGLFGPTFNGLLSQAAGDRSQGIVQGGSQSMQSLARIFGPLLGAAMYTAIALPSPYVAGAAISVLAIFAIVTSAPSRLPGIGSLQATE